MENVANYNVELFTNPDKALIAYWLFDDQASARSFFEGMKKGSTAYTVTVTLQQDGDQMEAFQMGNEEQDQRPLEKVNYQALAAQFQQPLGTDDFDRHLLTDAGK